MMNKPIKGIQWGELDRDFLPSQRRFWNSTSQFVLLNGGMGSGKTEIMILKSISDAITIPNNFILLGRETYQEIYDSLLKDFLDLCPPQLIKSYKKSPHPSIELFCPNSSKTSTIIFRNLDKMAETEIKGLNLGQFGIDQIEKVPEATFQGLTMRLRRKGCNHRAYCTQNPALNWLFQKIKKEKAGNWEVIEMPSNENYVHLPKDTVELYERYKLTDPAYYRQMVLGVWDESLLSENTVFSRDHIERMEKGIVHPVATFEDLNIFKEPIAGHRYQMGIDCAEGLESGDWSAVSVVDLDTLEEVASWAGKVPPEAVADRAVGWAQHYSHDDYRQCMINPEMNAMGLALLNRLKELGWTRIYQREDFDKKTGKKSLKLGWRTTVQTKPLLISNFRHLLRHFSPYIRTKETIAEFRSFIFTDEARKAGAGAQEGFHDDRIIATLLAFWEKTRRDPKAVILRTESNRTFPLLDIVPSITIRNGQIKVSDIPELEMLGDEQPTKSWKIG